MFDEVDSVQLCVRGTTARPRCPSEILAEMRERLPHLRLWNFYGQTEMAPLASALDPVNRTRTQDPPDGR